jgi:hypothetical protein
MPDSGDKDNSSIKKASADGHRCPYIFSVAQVNVQENLKVDRTVKKEKWSKTLTSLTSGFC